MLIGMKHVWEEYSWEESNFLTCLAANQSYFLSYLAFLNIGVSSLHFIVIWIKEHALHARAKKTFIQNIFVNEKNYSSWLSGKAEKVNDPFWNIYGEKIFEIFFSL